MAKARSACRCKTAAEVVAVVAFGGVVENVVLATVRFSIVQPQNFGRPMLSQVFVARSEQSFLPTRNYS